MSLRIIHDCSKDNYQIKSFIILAISRLSALRVCGAHLRVITPGQHSSFWRNVATVARRWSYTVSNLTGPRLEPQTSGSRDERVTTPPTNRLAEITFSSFFWQKFFLHCSRAIASYLCNQYEKGDDSTRLYPVDPKARGLVDQIMYVSENTNDQIMAYTVSSVILKFSHYAAVMNRNATFFTKTIDFIKTQG